MARSLFSKPPLWVGSAIIVVLVVLALGMGEDNVKAAAYPSETSSPSPTSSPIATPSPTASLAPAKLVCTCKCIADKYQASTVALCVVPDTKEGMCKDYNLEFADIKEEVTCRELNGTACIGYLYGERQNGKLDRCKMVASASPSPS